MSVYSQDERGRRYGYDLGYTPKLTMHTYTMVSCNGYTDTIPYSHFWHQGSMVAQFSPVLYVTGREEVKVKVNDNYSYIQDRVYYD